MKYLTLFMDEKSMNPTLANRQNRQNRKKYLSSYNQEPTKPTEPEQSSTRSNHQAPVEPLDFVREMRRIRRNLPSCMAKATDAEKREYATVAACLLLGIEPATIDANICSLVSEIRNNQEAQHGI